MSHVAHGRTHPAACKLWVHGLRYLTGGVVLGCWACGASEPAPVDGRPASVRVPVDVPIPTCDGSCADEGEGLVVVDGPGGAVVSVVELGSARVGTDAEWRTLVLENRGDGTAHEIALVFEDDGGSGSIHFADFQFPGTGGTCSSSLAAGWSCTVVVQFSPMAVGSISGTIRTEYIEGGDLPYAVLVEVSGTGTGEAVYAASDAAIRDRIEHLGPGMTLIIEDGQYSDLVIVGTIGSASSPAIVRSRNDGGAHVRSMDLRGVSYVHLIGIQAGLGRDGIDGHVVDIEASDHLVLERVTAHHAQEAGNKHVFEISESRYVTLEDCAAWGSGRIQFLYYDSEFGIFRRVWGQHLHNASDAWPRTVLALYYGANSLVENSVATQALDADPDVGQIEGFKVNSRLGTRVPSNNTIRGNVAHDLQGPAYYTTGDYDFSNTHFYNNVAVGPQNHYLDTAFDPTDQAFGTEVHQHTAAHMIMAVGRPSSGSGGDGIEGLMTHSIFLDMNRKGRTEAISWSLFEDIADLSSPLDNNNRVVSGLEFRERVFGRVGAYLLRPASARGQGQVGANVGAEILFRYAEVDDPVPTDRAGTLTTIPLWPHPLEERVWRESRGTISITYESRDGRSGLRGIWRDPDALREAYVGR